MKSENKQKSVLHAGNLSRHALFDLKIYDQKFNHKKRTVYSNF